MLVRQEEIMGTICPSLCSNRQPKYQDLNTVTYVHNLTRNYILPKPSHREVIPLGYTFVIFCLIKGIHLSLTHLMISFMVYCIVGSKVIPICPYLASITTMFEQARLDKCEMEKTHIKVTFESATLSWMRIKVLVNVHEPLNHYKWRHQG